MNELDCLYCIDTRMPCGRDDALGELFERCPVCTQPCPRCDGIAVYPANYDNLYDLARDLATLALAPTFCLGCGGIVALSPLGPTEAI